MEKLHTPISKRLPLTWIPGRGRRVISLSEHDQIGFVGVQLICRRSTLGIADIQPGAAGCKMCIRDSVGAFT